MTALVGASGAGKTTLADLIPRFHDPTKGQVLIDGVDLRQIEINSLRRKMAVVSQDTFIFNTSVRNNIAYGTEGASDAELKKSLVSLMPGNLFKKCLRVLILSWAIAVCDYQEGNVNELRSRVLCCVIQTF
jgi:ABC-type multidrug transport system fused ATPase/permease subunit